MMLSATRSGSMCQPTFRAHNSITRLVGPLQHLTFAAMPVESSCPREIVAMDSETFLAAEVLAMAGGFSFVILYAAARVLSRRSYMISKSRKPVTKPPEERPIPMPAHL